MMRSKTHLILRIFYVIVLFALIFSTSQSHPPLAFNAGETMLRVCVLKDAGTLTLSIKGDYRMLTLYADEVIDKGRDLKGATVVPAPSGLLISGEPLKIHGVRIVPKTDASIYIGERVFRGNVNIIRTEELKLLVINEIDLEDYLKGVLYHEVSHWWPIETLKAQAIAARTYALNQRSARLGKDYDLTSDIYSQVYGGRGSERGRTNMAVELTRGMVLTYNKEIFPAYYHAACGGYTEDASNLWKTDLPPLKVRKCNFCRLSPHYRWLRKLPIREVEKKLRAADYSVKGLKSITARGTTSSKRVEDIVIIGREKTVIPAKDFRLAVSPNVIRSTNFRIKMNRDNIIFYGHGWGHGVGMCQWGAFFLGLKRYKADRILRYYYPGTKIYTIYP